MNQSGLHKIILYENRNIYINYTDFTIITEGVINTLNNHTKLIIDPQAVNINYTIIAQVDDLVNNQVDQLNNSIYGWIAELHFLDDSIKIIERPFIKPSNSEINSNISNSRNIELTSWNRQGLIAFS